MYISEGWSLPKTTLSLYIENFLEAARRGGIESSREINLFQYLFRIDVSIEKRLVLIDDFSL